MESRKQMTFYASFWDAINNLGKKDQLPVFRAVVSYGLTGTHEENLTVSQNAFFSLMKPVLDSSRRKAEIGKQGGSKAKANSKQSESKPQANSKQTASEGEKENEIEIEKETEIEYEIEIENECYISLCGGGGEAREASPQSLASVGLKPGEYLHVTETAVENVSRIADSLTRTYLHRSPTPADCRKTFEWCFNPSFPSGIGKDAVELLIYAFGASVIAEKPSWKYAEGVMHRLACRNITTLADARAFDAERNGVEEET